MLLSTVILDIAVCFFFIYAILNIKVFGRERVCKIEGDRLRQFGLILSFSAVI